MEAVASLALLHDLGKACWGRFNGDHAAAGAELLRAARFSDAATLQAIQRHHHPLRNPEKHYELHCLQLADRAAAASARVEGGSSNSFTSQDASASPQQHLQVVAAYLQHGLKRHFQRYGADDYDAFKRFVQGNWWLESVRASSTDALNESLRHHLLLTDAIYQQLLLNPATEQQLTLSAYQVPAIVGRKRDLQLRITIVGLLSEFEEGMHTSAYRIWKLLTAERGIRRDKRFIARVVDELWRVGILSKSYGQYSLQRGFAPTQLTNKPQTHRRDRENAEGVERSISAFSAVNKKTKRLIAGKLAEGFSVDRVALELGITQMEVLAAEC